MRHSRLNCDRDLKYHICRHCDGVYRGNLNFRKHMKICSNDPNVPNRDDEPDAPDIHEVMNGVMIKAKESLERLRKKVESQNRRNKSLQAFRDLVTHLENDVIDITYVSRVILEISRGEHIGADLNLYDRILLRTSIKHNHSEVMEILEGLSKS